MNLKTLETVIKNELIKHDLTLFSLTTKKEFGENILEIIVDGSDLSSDHLGDVNVAISELLTEDIFDPNYYLEVSSPGAERPLRTLEEVKAHIGAYVHIKTPTLDTDATLLSVNEETLMIQINLKGRLKKEAVSYQDVMAIRLAIKF